MVMCSEHDSPRISHLDLGNIKCYPAIYKRYHVVLISELNLWCRQGSCKREVGNQGGSRRMRKVVTVMLVGTGKQDAELIGKRFLIYLDRRAICLHVK